MEKVLSWIVENYELLILVGACLLDVVLFLVGVLKKNKKLPSIHQVLLNSIPSAINSAEKFFGAGHGDEKLYFALGILGNIYLSETGQKMSLDGSVCEWLKARIEDVLSTPQKKGK